MKKKIYLLFVLFAAISFLTIPLSTKAETNNYDIGTTAKSVYLNPNNDYLTMELRIVFYDPITKTTSCIPSSTQPTVVLDEDGNLSTTDDQISPVHISRNSSNCENWWVDFDTDQIESDVEYKVLAKLPYKSGNSSSKQQEQVYYTKGHKTSNSATAKIEFYEAPNDRLSLNFNDDYNYNIGTTLSKLYLNSNNGYITLHAKINYYDPVSKKSTCISKNTKPSVVLDADGDLNSKDDQVTPVNISQDSSNCHYWWVDFNTGDLKDAQSYKMIATLPKTGNNASKSQSEQIYYTHGKQSSTLQNKKLIYEEKPDNRLTVTYTTNEIKNIGTTESSTYFNYNNNFITMNIKINYYDPINKKSSCISSSTPPKVVLDVDNDVNTVSDQIEPVKVTQNSSDCNYWWVDFDPKLLQNGVAYHVIATLPENNNNASKKQTEQIYYTGGTVSTLINENTFDVYEAPNDRLTISVHKAEVKIGTTITKAYLNPNNKYITFKTKINEHYPDGTSKCIASGSEPQVFLDQDNDLYTTNDRIYPTNVSRDSSDCNYWWIDFDESQLSPNVEYGLYATLPNYQTTYNKQTEQLYFSQDTFSDWDNNRVVVFKNSSNRMEVSVTSNDIYNWAELKTYSSYGESLNLYVDGWVNGNAIDSIALTSTSGNVVWSQSKSDGSNGGSGYTCASLYANYHYKNNCLDKGIPMYKISEGSYYVKAYNSSYPSNKADVYLNMNNWNDNGDNVFYTLPRDGKRNKVTLKIDDNNGKLMVVVDQINANEIPSNYYDFVVDPGHGDSDIHASQGPNGYSQYVQNWWTMSAEKDYNLVPSEYLVKRLEAQGFKVYETRDRNSQQVSDYGYGKKGTTSDTFGKYSRVGSPYEVHASYYVSVHHNGGENTSSGYQVYSTVATSTYYADNVAKEFSTVPDSQGAHGTDGKGNQPGTYKRVYGEGGPCGYSSSTYNNMDYYYMLRETGGASTTCKDQTTTNDADGTYNNNAYYSDRNGANAMLLELTYIQNPETMSQLYSNNSHYYTWYMDAFIRAFCKTYNVDYVPSSAATEEYYSENAADETHLDSEGIYYTNEDK